ncbi:hypothetical protein LQG66_04735 [Bradyrhizobium ontarionense]|uniref:DUF2335 domain-containing protein n=1 Tax=Bradyrhizobium ontarionense TaxID=2898149 RepID=A0ABY3RE16_9BRAD|nr:hypothetical protein [Bradyrhizobium sp. A19]UFZ05626.1 hypothetical protein LQG66_04735 [Bradyrhizobium sp. A19]
MSDEDAKPPVPTDEMLAAMRRTLEQSEAIAQKAVAAAYAERATRSQASNRDEPSFLEAPPEIALKYDVLGPPPNIQKVDPDDSSEQENTAFRIAAAIALGGAIALLLYLYGFSPGVAGTIHLGLAAVIGIAARMLVELRA